MLFQASILPSLPFREEFSHVLLPSHLHLENWMQVVCWIGEHLKILSKSTCCRILRDACDCMTWTCGFWKRSILTEVIHVSASYFKVRFLIIPIDFLQEANVIFGELKAVKTWLEIWPQFHCQKCEKNI